MEIAQHTGMAHAFDGPIDPAIEQGPSRHEIDAEQVAHAILKLVGTHPGLNGRIRTARIIGGYAIPYRTEDEVALYTPFVLDIDWTLREITRFLDALLNGGLITATPGQRPVLVLTQSGHRALEVLEREHARAG